MRIAGRIRLWAVPLVLAAATAGTSAQAVSDARIEDAVELQLLDSEAAPSHGVDVSSEDGIVTLTGQARHLLARELAADLARQVRGVRSVINRVEVLPSGRTDEQLRGDVLAALSTNPATDETDVDARVREGEVDLLGEVPSLHSARIHEQVARAVRGVRSVDGEGLILRRPPQRGDVELESEIRALLGWDAALERLWIDVDLEGGVASLSGRVASAAQRRHAQRVALIEGVERVDVEDLVVDPALLGELERSDPRPEPPDDRVRAAIVAALQRDPRVPPQRVEAHFGGRLAVLSGQVEDLQARRAAEQVARDTTGVRRVRNLIRVRPTTPPPDEVLERRVLDALERDPLCEDWGIGVDAFAGEVYLAGAVGSRWERRRAEDVVADVVGVRQVHNLLRLARSSRAPDALELSREVCDRLEWNPLVDPERIGVEVEPGAVVVLSGRVGTLWARAAAERDAWRAGARRVRNELAVSWPLAQEHVPEGSDG